MLGIILSVFAALLFGISAGIQKFSVRNMKRFSVRNMIKNKKWLSSLAIGGIGIISYLIALRSTDLSIVQSVLSLTLITPIIIGYAFFKERMEAIEWVSITLLVIGVFLAVF